MIGNFKILVKQATKANVSCHLSTLPTYSRYVGRLAILDSCYMLPEVTYKSTDRTEKMRFSTMFQMSYIVLSMNVRTRYQGNYAGRYYIGNP